MSHITTCIHVFFVKNFNLIENCKSFKVLSKLSNMKNVTIKIRKPKFNSHTEKQTKHSKEGISLLYFCLFVFLRQDLIYPRLVLNS